MQHYEIEKISKEIVDAIDNYLEIREEAHRSLISNNGKATYTYDVELPEAKLKLQNLLTFALSENNGK